MSRRRQRKGGISKARPWQRLRRGEPNPAAIEAAQAAGEMPPGATYEVWANDVYEASVIHYPNIGAIEPRLRGTAYITLKRYDRHAVHDWRHFQQIKNETCGPEREALELYPAESRLVDEANQYHLYVMPEGVTIPFGGTFRQVSTDEQLDEFNRGRERGEHKGRQRPWQPGLTTGRTTEDGDDDARNET